MWNDSPAAAVPPHSFTFVPISAAHAHMILAWRYDPPYDCYNPAPDASEQAIAEVFLNPEYHYYAVLDQRGDLIAFRCFGADARVPGGNYTADALDMGGGMRPDLTGRGLGPHLMRAAMAFACPLFHPRAFRTTVASWNVRALRACLRAGYRPTTSFHNPHGVAFTILMQPATRQSPDPLATSAGLSSPISGGSR